MKHFAYLYLTILTFAVMGCSSSSVDSGTSQTEVSDCTKEGWLLSCDQILDGGPGQDGIPSIDKPNFSPVSDITFHDDHELVLGVKVDNQVKAYPNVILYYHEIANDVVGNQPLAITYCPLTGSGIAWNRTLDGTTTTFGVSGLIHKNNLIAYDRATGSNWSQMKNKSVHGTFKGTATETVQLVEMTWGSWKKAFPNSQVLNTNTGYSRNYNKYLYGADYPDDNSRILFPIYNEDSRLERKVLVHSVNYGLYSKAYPIRDFETSMQVINDTFEGHELVIAGNSALEMTVSFERITADGSELQFEAVTNDLPIIMKDQEGNRWNLFGEAVSGPREGETLTPTPSYNAYWFAVADFFNFPRIHNF